MDRGLQTLLIVRYSLSPVAPEFVDVGRSAIPTVLPRSDTPIIDRHAFKVGPTLQQLREADGPIDLLLDGRYQIDGLIGRGGMGMILQAFDLRCHRRVALKILDIESRNYHWGLQHFLHEAEIAARVRHRNVVTVHSYGSTAEGVIYMAMEHLRGRDLESIVENGPLSWGWTRYMMRQVCAGLAAIHRAGIVHRDIKASNCFYVEADAVVKLLDFGVAAKSRERPTLIVGTPEYMAPEQIRGRPCDHRVDVYSAGVLLCKLLTGRTPFRGETVEAIFDQHLDTEPPPLSRLAPNVQLPEGIDAVVGRALAKRPDDRFSTIISFETALSRLEPVTRGHRSAPRATLSNLA
jgi:serine/threonine protein kinase